MKTKLPFDSNVEHALQLIFTCQAAALYFRIMPGVGSACRM